MAASNTTLPALTAPEGLLHLVIGPMYSGKTSELIRLAERYRIAGKRVLVVKYGEDNRYTGDSGKVGPGEPEEGKGKEGKDDKRQQCDQCQQTEKDALVATHNGRFLEAISALTLAEIPARNLLENHDVLCIDEIQFYPDSELAAEWADSGKVVVASGLSGNYLREQFKGMPQLLSKADRIEHLTSVCMLCKHDGAAFSALRRDVKGQLGVEAAATKLIGGAETYLAVCRSCFTGS